jgi:SanA protein
LVINNADGRLFDEIETVPEGYSFGLLLGTTPQTRIGHRRNMFFESRIHATASLYHAGKIQKVLISGDDNSLDGVNEVKCMRDSLLERGIPTKDIILDGKGYRTILSVHNAYYNFGCRKLIVISQKFHNERALYLADNLGLGFDQVIGFNAKSPHSLMSQKTYVREWFARVKMFIDLFINNHYGKD